MGEVGREVDPKGSISRLWEAVWRQPWAMQVRLVMGDALQEAGDAHGELMAVQLALERLPDDDDEGEDAREARDALQVRERHLLKQLRSRLLGRFQPQSATWRAGFLDEVTVHDLSALTALVDCRAAWVLRSLTYMAGLDDFHDLVRRLGDGRGATLEVLKVGGRGACLGCDRRFRAATLFEVMPRLRRLELWSQAPDFHGAIGLRLEHLIIEPSLHEASVLSSLGAAHCPALKSLTISVVESPNALPPALLNSQTLGPLEQLHLDGAFEPEAVRAVLQSPLGATLKKVSVRLPAWQRWPVGELDWRDALDRLELFELLTPHFSPADARRIERLHPIIRVRHTL